MAAPQGQWIARGSALAGVLVAEFLLTTISFDTKDLLKKPGLLTSWIERWSPGILQASIVFALAFAGLLYLRRQQALTQILDRHANSRIRPAHLAAHLLFFALAFASAWQFFAAKPVVSLAPDLLGAACIALGVIALAFLLLALAPSAMLAELGAAGGENWVFAGGAAVLTSGIGLVIQRLWSPATVLTFAIVKWLLLFLPGEIVANPAAAEIGTQKFSVMIAKQCSGLEGIGLFLVFGAIGLIVFRTDFRFPRALLLMPLGIVTVYLFNAVRIALLIAIGNAGYKDVAAGGFHSQAGWISFNVVSLGLFAWARASAFFSSKSPGEPVASEAATEAEGDVAPYLMPFLTILATGMLVRATSAEFEWLYPLKFAAAAIVIWKYREHYRAKLDLRFGAPGIIAGIAVFLLWTGLDFLTPMQERGMPQPLAAAPLALRIVWIACRAAAASLTVPIAEELAFRAFLLRRFVSAGFEAVNPRHFTWLGWIASSLIFGLLHGDRWVAGSVAGAIYGWVVLRNGRLGDAIVAHATTNALLSLVVLLFSAWRYW